MSLRTRINGFTAWVNLRLTPYNQLLNNVLMDLLTGTHMRYLVESFTGSHLKGLENMDGLTDQQKQTRIDWVVAELKRKNVIAEDVFVDTRLFAMRSADHVFNLLWRMISHDIWFVWERAEYLQVEDLDVLTQVPFKWTPEPPPKKKKHKNKSKKSLLSGFGPPVGEESDKQSEKSEEVKELLVALELSRGNSELPIDTPEVFSETFSADQEIYENPSRTLDVDADPEHVGHYYSDVGTNRESQIDSRTGHSFVTLEQNIVESTDSLTEPADGDIVLTDAECRYITKVGTNQESEPDSKTGLAYIPVATLEENTVESTDYQQAEDGDVLPDAEHGYITADSPAEYRKELVSIYMIPLNDIDQEDDIEEAENLFPGRASPWPEEDLEHEFYEIGTNRYSSNEMDMSEMGTDQSWSNEIDVNEMGTNRYWNNKFDVEMYRSMYELPDSYDKRNGKYVTVNRKKDRLVFNQFEGDEGKTGLYTGPNVLNNMSDATSEPIKASAPDGLYASLADHHSELPDQQEVYKLSEREKSMEVLKTKGGNSHRKDDISAKGRYSVRPRNPVEQHGEQSRSGSSMSKSSIKSRSKTPSTKGNNSTSKQQKGNNSPFVRIQTPALPNKTEERFVTDKDIGTLDNDNEVLSELKDDNDEKWIMFPNAEYMKGFKKKPKNVDDYPSPDECVLEMVNYQLKLSRDGKGLFCYSIDDFVDSRVLCALVNSFVPNTFTADLLLNDRWTINLALKTAEKMFYAETPFDAEDLVEADPMAVSAYFAFFLMVAYRYRQTTAVVNRVDFINMLIRECNHELEKFPPIISNMLQLQRRKDLKQQLDQHRQAIENIQKKYDVEFCKKWVGHVEHVQNELRREIRDKMRSRFDIVEIPRNITINDFCLAAVINLSLTNGSGFYLTNSKENLSEGRRLVLRNVDTGEFIEDFTNKSKMSIKDALHIPDVPGQVVELNPEDYPDYEFFFEAQSRNKQLKTGSYFLYQVFPGNTSTWQRLFIKSARDAEFETVEKMIAFFREDSSFINCREPKSGNTALHLACRMGHFDIVRLLLENGAKIDLKNNFRCTPINLAIEGLQRKICHYLIEWGCDVHNRNVKGQTVLETIKNDDFKRFCMELYDYYSEVVPKIMAGDMQLLEQVITNHKTGAKEFCCLRSRIINGSTLLHTACYYGHIPAIKELLSLRVDVNLRDYKGATPLHRAKNPEVMEILLEAGAHVNSEDSESNTPLHVKCYGESTKPSETECIQMLLNKNANITIRNSKGLMPIHCCVMQGRIDLMQLLLHHDKNNSMATCLTKENDKKPPSLIHLALANDFIDCAEWLLSNGFEFKDKEQDIMVRRILTEQIKLMKRAEAIKFLLDNGAEPNPKYPGGNSALHYAAGLTGPSDVLELLVAYKADIDILNEDGCTPLFFAAQSNNKYAACVLIEQGTNVRQKNAQGLTAFDYIVDFEEWIECGYFNEEIKARLKAYNLKHARDLIRAISKRVKPGQLPMIRPSYSNPSPAMSSHYHTPSSMSHTRVLPPVSSAGGTAPKYLMF